jgi:hypothetical protein
MKKILLFILLAGLLLPATKVCAEGQTLVLHHADGTTTEVELQTMPRIQLSADKMTVTSQGISQEYAKADVVRFTYKGVGTGITTVKPTARYRVEDDGQVTFYGTAAEAGRIRVYNSNGVQMPVSLSNDGAGNAILPLNTLPQGVYIVNINGRTIKFIRP